MGASKRFLLTVARHYATHVPAFLRRHPRPTHVLFCMTDHYEPGHGKADRAVQRQRIQELVDLYPPTVDDHRDAYGNKPGRSWFIPPHDHRNGNFRDVVSLCERGYGEIEVHLHHGKVKPDTAENLATALRLIVRDYSVFGALGMQDGRKRYGFIHGDWALNNCNPRQRYCGVNNELAILQETGCYADFTFPSCDGSNPLQLNSIYYADVNRHVPKAADRGVAIAANRPSPSGLLLIQGPVRPMIDGGRLSMGDGIHNARYATPKIIDGWVSTAIHVAGRSEWVVVKTHTHGAVNGQGTLGKAMSDAFSYMEQRYNDGQNYVLHYVTARELYNIVKAAEAGKSGNPEDYRDYLVSRPKYDSSPEIMEASQELREVIWKTYQG